jgi:hypothetical protein
LEQSVQGPGLNPDYDYDQDLKNPLIGQAKKPNSPAAGRGLALTPPNGTSPRHRLFAVDPGERESGGVESMGKELTPSLLLQQFRDAFSRSMTRRVRRP